MSDAVWPIGLPTRSKSLWLSLGALFVIVMALTVYKDWRLTGERPNVYFYLLVPPVSILGGVLASSATAKLIKQSLTFLDTVAILVSVNILMQASEIVLKLIYHLVWHYAGFLYTALTVSLGIGLMVVGFARQIGVKWRMALVLALAGFIGEAMAGGLFTIMTGLSTPGS